MEAGGLEDGNKVPYRLSNGENNFAWELDITDLLQSCERYFWIAAISRTTGINQQLLIHYANDVKIRRNQQRDRIAEGLHSIGRECLSIQ